MIKWSIVRYMDINCKVSKGIVQSVRFELTHPKILRPERNALDLSAKIASAPEVTLVI
jgi:hypothetical protein